MKSILPPCCHAFQTSANNPSHDCSPETTNTNPASFSTEVDEPTFHHVSDSSSPLAEEGLVFARRFFPSSVNSGSGWMKPSKHIEKFYLDVIFLRLV